MAIKNSFKKLYLCCILNGNAEQFVYQSEIRFPIPFIFSILFTFHFHCNSVRASERSVRASLIVVSCNLIRQIYR